MNELVGTTIRTAHAEGLTFRMPDDLADLIELDHLANQVLGADASPAYLSCLDPTVTVGNVTLRRPSLGVVEWLSDRLDAWCPTQDDKLRTMAWALAHGDDPACVWGPTSPDALRKTVRAWCRTVGATVQDLHAVIDRYTRADRELTDEENAQASRRRKSDHGWMIETLLGTYGGTVEQWVWQTPVDTIQLLLRELMRRKEHERRAAGGDASAPDPDHPHVRALYAFRKAEEALFAKLRSRHGQ